MVDQPRQEHPAIDPRPTRRSSNSGRGIVKLGRGTNHSCRLSVADRRTARRAARCTDHGNQISSMRKSDTCLVSRGAEVGQAPYYGELVARLELWETAMDAPIPPESVRGQFWQDLGLLLPLNRSWCFRHKWGDFVEEWGENGLRRPFLP